jgi:hypothetical protein
MLTRIRRLPSPALVISAIALAIAIGGGGYAIASLNSGKVKKIAKKQANKQIKKKAPHLSVAHAATADNATHATSADTATSAGTLNGVSVKQFSVKVTPGNSATLLDTGLVTFTGACSGAGIYSVTMTKDAGAPSEAARWSAAANNAVTTSGNADFAGPATISAAAAADSIQAEVTTTTGKTVSFSGMGRDTTNFTGSEDVCVFSGTVTSN